LGNRNIPYKKNIGEFEDSLSTMLTISIFTFLGAQIAFNITTILLLKQALFLAFMILLIRPGIIFLLTKKNDFSMFDRILMSMTGSRGAATAAVAAIPLTYALQNGLETLVPEANLILITAFFTIFFTMLSGTVTNIIMCPNKKKDETKEEKKINQ
jgi:NhaP-type Na+/H+ or K+/H+ antiporter